MLDPYYSKGIFLGGVILISVWITGISAEDCKLTPVYHNLQSPGCNSITIPSFACVGKCTSYVQVSGSKMWEMERSCMCCQESGERVATVTLNCPGAPAGSKVRKVMTKAPMECMCRPCSAVEEGSVLPQEIGGFSSDMQLRSMYTH
ncbi:unnamed protein product [Allacma fusca]|uniref:Bursicon n=1 Tax=Allacma fusca TaxID=39272 RepID=A0A8J2KVQ1_9HEXA|nr:unnamed protein product [Allacma fusca]